MTQQPPQPPSDQSPQGSVPLPGWSPAPLSDGARPWVGGGPAQAQEPANRLGGPTLRSVKIDEFAPPRSRLPLLITLIVMLVAGLIWGATLLRPVTPVPAAGSTATPSQTAAASGLPFLTPDERYAGRWEILEYRWTDSGLEVEIRISVDRGPFSYSFLAFENSGVDATSPDPGSQPPRFSGLPIATGEQESGWLFFPLDRGPATIILATAGGNQMSALPVGG
ncbi:MAG: hypothetical protein IT193_14080 [Propionibacteriaceae bacterium]|nr:hypothetical protein [Propionibacteriaceae bacterium]